MRNLIRSSERYRWYALAVIMLGSTMGTLDASIANVALPTIAHAYAATLDETEWVLLAFMLVTSSTLVLFGRLGDMFGQKRIYLGGFAIFGLSSLACAFAPSLAILIAARAIQAIGAAMLVSSNQALIVDTFPATERGRAIGFNGGAVAVGLSLGPIVGGAIVTFWHWQWIFLINVPISLLAMLGASLVLKPVKRGGSGFDPIGAVLCISGLFLVSLALSRGNAWGWETTRTVGALVAGAVLLAAFVFVERRVSAPTLDLKLFSNRLFAMSVLGAFVYFVAIAGLVFIVPLAAQTALHYSPFLAGLMLTPITAMNVFLAPTAGALSDRVPIRYVSTFGACCVALGLFLISRLPAEPTSWQIVLAVIVAGFGTAVFSQPNNSAIMGSAPANQRGIAAGTLATARTTGQLLGVATAGAVYFLLTQKLGTNSFAPAGTYFGLSAIVMVGVAAISWIRE